MLRDDGIYDIECIKVGSGKDNSWQIKNMKKSD